MKKLTPVETMQIMLNDVVEHFGSNPKELINNVNGSCKYTPLDEKPLSNGCAIGMYIDNETCVKLDSLPLTSIINVIKSDNKKLLPKWMQEVNPNFLQYLQNLHDMASNWDDVGLSKQGVAEVEMIKKKFDL